MMHQYIDTLLKEEGFEDLVSSYSDILTALYLNDGQLKMHQISELVGKDKSTVTVLVNRLIDRDYIIKEKSTLDRRVTYIKLTEKAKGHQKTFMAMKNHVNSIVFEGFKDDEVELLIEFMNRLQENLEDVLKK